MTRRILVTGAEGFVGRNLLLALEPRSDMDVLCFNRGDRPKKLEDLVAGVDAVVHLAGANRPPEDHGFTTDNVQLTKQLADALTMTAAMRDGPIPVIFASSTQATLDNAYGRSKLAAEKMLIEASAAANFTAHVFRFPNVFGKWARPNYNSAVATFCHNIARGLPIALHDPCATLRLIYIDDVVNAVLAAVNGEAPKSDSEGFAVAGPIYTTTVGRIAELIEGFSRTRDTLTIGSVGVGLERALYATYVSYLPTAEFSYPLPVREDPRGRFVEMLRTELCGQFSFFTAHPGITRGGHYHHTKTEKFLVLQGRARFCFRHMRTGERFVLETTADEPRVVDTVPGWTHDITNVGAELLIVMLWANELFDPANPDTFASPVNGQGVGGGSAA